MDCAKWTGSIVVACLLAGAGVAVAQTPDDTRPPPLGAALESCATSALPTERAAAFVGTMPAIAKAERMQMRFDLERRHRGESRWQRLRGVPGFGVWETALPGRAGFVFHKRIAGLQVPAAYRALVRFRWQDADGATVRREHRRTRSCSQPDLRPDLVVGSLRAIVDARPALAIYTVAVRNDGRSPAGRFAIGVAGGVSEVAGLAAGGRVDVVVIAAACAAGSAIQAIVDADRRVDEAQERNGLQTPCPLGG